MVSIKNSITSLAILASLVQSASAFQPINQQSLITVRQGERVGSIQSKKTSLHIHPSSSFFDDVFLLSDSFSDPKATAVAAASAAAGVPDPTSMFNMNVGETVRNVAVGITALVFAFVAITSLAAAVLIPAGAEQLKIECEALIPNTWQDYLAKLEEGEEMKDRPDLMFELGLLLNKCKADRLEQVCIDLQLGPELWEKYQGMLDSEQELQDRPEFIAAMGAELSQRAGQVLKENTNICPESTWEAFQEKSGDIDLIENPMLLEELSRDLGYPDLVGACVACLAKDAQAPAVIDVEVEAREDATTITGITEIRRNSDQWGEDDE
eukprot:CAMPEP_0116117746 /NCGR_PEP_ID=MMETSP0329-20121206/1735_1 /TAXON_ID=697910 /ORGANISM="Pseudo-nitzschia arenysensis, Strain B593" /LENGTH=323 /DNA_ID=CAMNT_0003611327 /DNA_START=108 /DNA_END=1079 /DNA_ORIENTATION=+